ncbi:response regulator [Nannocystaceae bacterium ST9]
MNPELRILVVDDDRAIHEDIRRALTSPHELDDDLQALERQLFELDTELDEASERFEVHSAFQGRDGAQQVRSEREQGRRYALALVDMRMPPGWDGVRTAEAMLALDDELPIVFCTAYADAKLQLLTERLAPGRRIETLQKPFRAQQLRALALALARGRDA